MLSCTGYDDDHIAPHNNQRHKYAEVEYGEYTEDGMYISKGKYIECTKDGVYDAESRYGEYAKEVAALLDKGEPLATRANDRVCRARQR
jgi:hypothetical protein